MTFKQFQRWCNDRACDGCWGYQEALLCIEVMEVVRKIPFWKREKFWKKIADVMVTEIVGPTNRKIKEITGVDVDAK